MSKRGYGVGMPEIVFNRDALNGVIGESGMRVTAMVPSIRVAYLSPVSESRIVEDLGGTALVRTSKPFAARAEGVCDELGRRSGRRRWRRPTDMASSWQPRPQRSEEPRSKTAAG